MKIECKTTNGLMKHLRNKHHISINGGKQKQQLINQGYFHGFKGYRFFKNSSNPIAFNNYEQINQTIIFDSKLKSIFYEKVVFLETAIKSVVLQKIVNSTRDGSIDAMFENVIQNYNKTDHFATTHKERKIAQEKHLNLKSYLISKIAKEYHNSNDKVAHFYENNDLVPLWALFDILMLGDFGQVLSALIFDIRNDVSNYFNIPLSMDSSREVFTSYVYALKDLRNSIAHNGVVYDVRFLSFRFKHSSLLVLSSSFGNAKVDFTNISDFVLLIIFLMKALKISKTEQKAFVNQFIAAIDSYKNKVGESFYLRYFTDDARSKLISIKCIL